MRAKKNSDCIIPNHRNSGKMTVVDTTILKVWYAFNADGVKDVNTCIGQQCLDLEKRIMKYCSDFFSSRIF